MRRLPRLILVFWLAELRALVGKMAFLVTVITGGSAHVSIFPMRWLVVATIILRRSLVCIDSSAQSKALRLGAARAAIATIPIMSTLLIVPALSF